jgi:hypothetical protein
MPFKSKEAEKAYQREYQEKNRDRLRAARIVWGKTRTKEARHEEYLKRKDKAKSWSFINLYGISLEKRDRLISLQGGRCAICKNTFLSDKDTHIDHCHSTGEVRSILCRACNHLIGNCKEDIEILSKAIEYLGGIK